MFGFGIIAENFKVFEVRVTGILSVSSFCKV